MQAVYIIMGVSGTGKTTIGKLWSEKLGVPFYDADDFHPKANVDKMRNGVPLSDEDRKPWLETLAEQLQKWEAHEGAVLACSALKASYRSLLASKADIQWIYLHGNYETIWERMKSRAGHYMKPELLQSQFDTLEIPEYGVHVDIHHSPEAIITILQNTFSLKNPPQND